MNQQQLDIECEERTVVRTVAIPLTVGERDLTLKELVELNQKKKDEHADFDTKKLAHKQAITAIETQNAKLLDQAENGIPQNVECIEKRLYGTNTIQIWHEDKMIEERAMSVNERQMTIEDAQDGVVIDADFVEVEETDEISTADIRKHINQETRRIDSPKVG